MVEGPRMTSPTLVSGLEQGRGDVHLQSLELYWCLCEEEFNFIFMKSGQKHFFQMINSSYWMSNMPVQFFWEKCLKLHEGPWAKRQLPTNFYKVPTNVWPPLWSSQAVKLVLELVLSGDLQSFGRVVKRRKSIKIGMQSPFGPRSLVEFVPLATKKIGLA